LTTPQPSPRDIEQADKLTAEWMNVYGPRGAEYMKALIAQALAEVRAEYAAFADENGKPRKVLGTLPVTADGCIVGFTATLWVNDVGDIKSGIADMPGWTEEEGSDSAFWPFHECYSNKAAALAAQEGE
jgi:hypothetical protein